MIFKLPSILVKYTNYVTTTTTTLYMSLPQLAKNPSLENLIKIYKSITVPSQYATERDKENENKDKVITVGYMDHDPKKIIHQKSLLALSLSQIKIYSKWSYSCIEYLLSDFYKCFSKFMNNIIYPDQKNE